MEIQDRTAIEVAEENTIEQNPQGFVTAALNQMFQDEERGFDVFIIMKSEDSTMKHFLFYEDGEQSFKKKIEDSIAETVKEKFLAEDAEYAMAENIADNQNKYYLIKQSAEYNPFKVLSVPRNNIETFSVSERDDADAILFRFKREGKSIWAYQNIVPANIPNKKKENFLAKVFTTEHQDRFIEMNEPLFPITRKINLLVIDDYIITKDTSLMQRHFGFSEFINAAAGRAVADITSLNLVSNSEKLTEYIHRTQTKYAKKMMRIKNYHVINKSADELLSKVKTVQRWQGVFDTTGDKINLHTYQDVENLIDLFDERFTSSLITGDEFDTDVKKLAVPVIAAGIVQTE
jgi:hypothetical protein